MTKRINREIGRLMVENLRRMRQERGWSQEDLAVQAATDRRYISAMESGRGIGKNLLDRLCGVFGVTEEAFTHQSAQAPKQTVDSLPRATRMILEELEDMPEYEQFRLLAEIVERRMKKLEEQIREKQTA